MKNAESDTTIEYADMTDEQKRIVDAGNEPPAGTFPTGLSREELGAWIGWRFHLGLNDAMQGRTMSVDETLAEGRRRIAAFRAKRRS